MQGVLTLRRVRFKSAIAALLAATAIAVAVPAATQPTQAEAIPMGGPVCQEWFRLFGLSQEGSDMEWFYRILLLEYCGPWD